MYTNGPAYEAYLRQVARYPVFETGEVERLFERLETEGEGEKYLRRLEIYHRFLRLVIKRAWAFERAGVCTDMSVLDFIQEGNIGLMNAVETFDWRMENSFSTYARKCIDTAIRNGIREYRHSSGMREPAHIQKWKRQVMAAMATASQRLGRHPELHDVFEAVEEYARQKGTKSLTLEQVGEAMRLLRRSSVSLDAELGAEEGDGARLYNILPNNKPSPESVSGAMEEYRLFAAVVDKVEAVVSTFSPRVAEVVSLRLGLSGKSVLVLDEIGTMWGLTRQRISQIEIQGMEKLEAAMGLTRDEIREILRMRDKLATYLSAAA